MQESTFSHLSHAFIITIILYLILLLLFKQSHVSSLHNSILLGASVLIYMLVFGHQLPKF